MCIYLAHPEQFERWHTGFTWAWCVVMLEPMGAGEEHTHAVMVLVTQDSPDPPIRLCEKHNRIPSHLCLSKQRLKLFTTLCHSAPHLDNWLHLNYRFTWAAKRIRAERRRLVMSDFSRVGSARTSTLSQSWWVWSQGPVTTQLSCHIKEYSCMAHLQTKSLPVCRPERRHTLLTWDQHCAHAANSVLHLT